MKDNEFFDKILLFIETFLEEDLDFRLNYSYVQEDDATYKVETPFGDKRELHSYEGIISFLEDILSKKSLNDI